VEEVHEAESHLVYVADQVGGIVKALETYKDTVVRMYS
jgi:hypothetical protein